jgi:YHS domain-containing protein
VSELMQVANNHQFQPGGAFERAVAAAPNPSQLNAAYANLAIGASPTVPPTNPPPATMAAVSSGAVPGIGTLNGSPAGTAPSIPSYQPPQQMAGGVGGYAPGTSATVPNTQAFTAQTPTATERYAVQDPTTVVDRYAGGPPAPAVPAPAQVTNPYAAVPSAAPAVQVPQAAPAVGIESPVPGQIAGSASPESQAPATLSNAGPIGGSAASVAAMPPTTPELPPGSAPLGFDGYCPVSMKKQWKWIPGSSQWGAVHRGRTYLFTGPAEQQEFLANPDFYSPVLSGNDPVIAIDQGQTIGGRREHSLEYNGQFYLFSSEANLQQFSGNPERYSTRVRQAMGLQPGSMVR